MLNYIRKYHYVFVFTVFIYIICSMIIYLIYIYIYVFICAHVMYTLVNGCCNKKNMLVPNE